MRKQKQHVKRNAGDNPLFLFWNSLRNITLTKKISTIQFGWVSFFKENHLKKVCFINPFKTKFKYFQKMLRSVEIIIYHRDGNTLKMI